jgi:dolichol-phosphate mannosyltransferase
MTGERTQSASQPALQATATVAVSLVVPVRDEADNVGPLHAEIAATMRAVGSQWELIFIDDGSADATFERLRQLHAAHPEVKVLRLARNFGKSAALAAGFDAARGAIVVTLDGDLQDDPREVPRFLAALGEGRDLVCGWKRVRRDPLGKRIASRIFNWVMARVTGLDLHDANCGFKAYRAEVARGLRLRRGLHRFIPFLAKARGYRVGEIVVAHRARTHGRSKYGWERIPQALADVHQAWIVARGVERPGLVLGVPGAALIIAGGLALLAAPVGPPVARWLWMTIGIIALAFGADLAVMAILTARAAAREPQGAAYSVAERLD